ncbi:MAG: class I SAM-dependent methyltransferase [Betaproteobacteria bacterium]
MSARGAALFRCCGRGHGADTPVMVARAIAHPRWHPARWPWPLPALATWLVGWGLFVAASAAGRPLPGLALALMVGVLGALPVAGLGRRLWVAAGFPGSAVALGVAPGVPGWVWLLPLLPLLLLYPLRAWRDAPFFPTPAAALDGLAERVGQPARVLEAGCGLGHGLAALRRQFPNADLVGLEWSLLLARLARWRRPDARVRRGDLWAEDWGGYGLVYLFQRPESMARAWAKAQAEMVPGHWLASLEFPVPGVAPSARLPGADGRPVWLYCVPVASRSTGGPGCR